MTLSLDDVRNKRFRMARKSGYEVVEVDEFVDEVEATVEQLIDENANLKKQVEALSAAPGSPTSPPAADPAQAHAPAQPAPQTIVVTTGKEASSAVVRLVELSTEQAERLVREATEDADRIRDEASRSAHQLTTDAQTRAERMESEARVNAERLRSDALRRAEQVDRDIDSRRVELFGLLERERDELAAAVTQLREFEASYRANLTNELRQHIATLERQQAEPDNAPELPERSAPAPGDQESESAGTAGGDGAVVADDAAAPSATPRLDALLGDQR